jgi:shikimate dehydrogenase
LSSLLTPAPATLPSAAVTPSVPARLDAAQPQHHPQAAPRKLLLGLIGSGIQASLSPALHEAEGQAQGLRVHYQIIDLAAHKQGLDALPQLLRAARTMGFAGLNITYPCKQAVMPLLDSLSPEAQALGAVNTVVFKDGRSCGYNTDGGGWRWAMERELPQANLGRVVLLGAGGAGSAIAHTLLRMGARELVLVDPDGSRACSLAHQLNAGYAGQHTTHEADVRQALRGATGLVHASPTGMDKQPGLPLPADLLRPTLWVSEIVYFPLNTPLVLAARAAGCTVVHGGGMAVGQALGAFEHFTGLQADADRMQKHILSLLGAD